jgi:hypothetical protein
MKITRRDIADKLTNWRDGNLSRDELFSWANEIYFPSIIDFDDWEGNEDNSVANEVLSRLDMLDIDSYSENEIPIFLEFLNTHMGQFEDGYKAFLDRLHNKSA